MEYVVLNDEIREKDGRRVHSFNKQGVISSAQYKEIRDELLLAEQFGKIRDLIYMQDKNGSELQKFIEPFSLFDAISTSSISSQGVLREANRLALNFASSLKTAIEISESFFKIRSQKEAYKLRQSELFDRVPGYRFWIRLRNYLIHHRQLYSGFCIADNRAVLTCSANILLEWHGWNVVLKQEIKKMDNTNCYLTIYPAILSFHFLASEWVFLNKNRLERLSRRLTELSQQFEITGEMYFSLDREKLYYVPLHELRNMHALLEWRENFFEQDGFTRLQSKYVPEELKSLIQNSPLNL